MERIAQMAGRTQKGQTIIIANMAIKNMANMLTFGYSAQKKVKLVKASLC
jgi:hypothetical protein